MYGEVYYGRIDPYRTIALVHTMPKNATGIVVNNIGYCSSNIPYVIGTLLYKVVPEYGRLHKIGQVIGYKPYYCSRSTSFECFSVADEYMYKHDIED